MTAIRSCVHCSAPLDKKRLGANYYKQKYCSQPCMFLSFRAGPDEFWAKVDKGPHPNGCWLYTGFTKWDGYGWLRRFINNKPRYLTAHRYAWILKHGEPPAGMHILHECDNPPCCNPDHLKLGTHAENMAEMASKGRANGGYHRKPVLHPDRVRPKRAA